MRSIKRTKLKILIITFAGDTHANAVLWALRAAGHTVKIWNVTDFPDFQSVTAVVRSEGSVSVKVRDAHDDFELMDAEVIWFRRYRKPRAPEAAHPADCEVIESESDIFLRGIFEMLPQKAFWINPLHSSTRANYKPIQLAAAASVGLTILDTYFSNDSDRISALFDREQSGGNEIILKTFRQLYWSRKDTAFVLPTTPVRDSIFDNPESIQWCPAIFQRALRKAYEVRATVMGGTILALRLNSQERVETAQDWRIMHDYPISVEPIELPPAIHQQCLDLTDRLGICFGCIDFIVTEDEKYVFLEINEMGQFLWVEEQCPSIPMLSTFVSFLESGNPKFKPDTEPKPEQSFAAYLSDAEFKSQMIAEKARHKKVAAEPKVVEC